MEKTPKDFMTAAEFQAFMKGGGKVGLSGPKKKKKGSNGDKAKADMTFTLIEMGLPFKKEYVFDEEEGRKYRFDYALPAHKIGIEYEGLFSEKSRHTTKTGFTNDTRKYNLAASQGWTVLRYTAINYGEMKKDILKIIDKRK